MAPSLLLSVTGLLLQAGAALLIATVFSGLHSRYWRPFLRHWTWSWVALAMHSVARAGAVYLGGTVSTDDPERLSRLVYDRGRDLAAARGVIIADTKFEFGRDREGAIRLIDEVLTPDSSRFWPADRYAPGGPQQSFDKQPLRDYLDAERRAGRWNGDAPPPPLPDAVIAATSERYRDAFLRLTGTSLDLTDL